MLGRPYPPLLNSLETRADGPPSLSQIEALRPIRRCATDAAVIRIAIFGCVVWSHGTCGIQTSLCVFECSKPHQLVLGLTSPNESIYQGWKRRRIYTRNVYIRVPYREKTIQYASAGGATDWRQTRVPPQRMRLKTSKTRDFHVSAGCRHFACTKILTVDPRHIALK